MSVNNQSVDRLMIFYLIVNINIDYLCVNQLSIFQSIIVTKLIEGRNELQNKRSLWPKEKIQLVEIRKLVRQWIRRNIRAFDSRKFRDPDGARRTVDQQKEPKKKQVKDENSS